MKREIGKEVILNKNDLKNEIMRNWNEIPYLMIENLIKSMKKGCMCIVKIIGCYINFFIENFHFFETITTLYKIFL